jgi:hypothetical protein
MKQPEPTLRCLPDGRKVAALLATAMQKEVSITLTLQPQREADGAGVIGRPEAAIA